MKLLTSPFYYFCLRIVHLPAALSAHKLFITLPLQDRAVNLCVRSLLGSCGVLSASRADVSWGVRVLAMNFKINHIKQWCSGRKNAFYLFSVLLFSFSKSSLPFIHLFIFFWTGTG